MALDRKAAKKAINKRSDTDPELLDAQRQAEDAKLAVAREKNNHKLKSTAQDMGLLGRFFGNEKHAPQQIVGLVLILCLILVSGVLIAGYNTDITKWVDVINGIWGFAGLALGYLMGQSGKTSLD